MASVIDICNRALQKLGAERITSLTQKSENARACNIIYEPIRNAELRSHPWNFAIKRARLAASSTTPAFGFDNKYALPSDFLRLLPPDSDYNYNSIDWQIEGKFILTNDTGSLDIRYIAVVEDPTLFDALFIEVLANRIAIELCEQLTQSNTKAQMVRDDYIRATREAKRLNAFENISAKQQTDTWITGRI